MNEHYIWKRQELLEHASKYLNTLSSSASTASSASTTTPSLDTFAELTPYFDATLKPSLFNIPQAVNPNDATKLSPTPAVFLLYYFGILRCPRGSLRVTVESQLPIGAGLGSSASFTATLSSGFVWLALKLSSLASIAPSGDYLGTGGCTCDASSNEPSPYLIPSTSGASKSGPPTIQPCVHRKDAINTWSYEGERIIHGNPSGLDNTTCVHGGVVLYRKVRPASAEYPNGEAGLMRPLKDIPSLALLVVNTRVPRNTAALVAGVGERLKATPLEMRSKFEEIEQIVGEWLKLLQTTSGGGEEEEGGETITVEEREAKVGTLMRRNQVLLDEMGVGHAIITRVLAAADSSSFVGKLTGAGGGGCIIVLKPTVTTTTTATAASTSQVDGVDSLTRFTNELNELKCEYLETIVGQAGVWLREDTNFSQTPEMKK